MDGTLQGATPYFPIGCDLGEEERSWEKVEIQIIAFQEFVAFVSHSAVSQIAMPPAKPLEVEILRRDPDSPVEEEDWVPYQEYGAKVKTSTNNWSCYILAKEGDVSAISVQSHFCTHACSKPAICGSMH